jgi:hypothetical protein
VVGRTGMKMAGVEMNLFPLPSGCMWLMLLSYDVVSYFFDDVHD